MNRTFYVYIYVHVYILDNVIFFRNKSEILLFVEKHIEVGLIMSSGIIHTQKDKHHVFLILEAPSLKSSDVACDNLKNEQSKMGLQQYRTVGEQY